MRWTAFLIAFSVCLAPLGCHSAYIAATISNHTGSPVSLIEVDYPSASFGTQTLSPGQEFHYRFKVLGTGHTSVQWTDASNREQKNSGPDLHEGDDGTLTITLRPGAAPSWDLRLIHRGSGS